MCPGADSASKNEYQGVKTAAATFIVPKVDKIR
jgi:hypothetical protein